VHFLFKVASSLGFSGRLRILDGLPTWSGPFPCPVHPIRRRTLLPTRFHVCMSPTSTAGLCIQVLAPMPPSSSVREMSVFLPCPHQTWPWKATFPVVVTSVHPDDAAVSVRQTRLSARAALGLRPHPHSVRRVTDDADRLWRKGKGQSCEGLYRDGKKF
jgi:hypothetical protein